MPVQLIAVSERPGDLEFCRVVAERGGFGYRVASSPDDLQTALIETDQKLVFWDVDAPTAGERSPLWSVSTVLPLVSRHVRPHHLFGLASSSVFELPETNRYAVIGHYCVRNYDDFARAWIPRLTAPLFSGEPFGLDYYRDPDAIVRRITLRNSREKTAAVEAFGNILTKRGMDSRSTQMVLRQIDELLMNAIFDAPVDDHGRPYRRELARDADFELKGREEVTVELCQNSAFAVVGVRDSFGSFVSSKATDRVRRDYSDRDYRVDPQTNSAGLGLQGAAANGVALVIAAKAGQATEAILAFPYYKSYRETKSGFRSFSFNLRGTIA